MAATEAMQQNEGKDHALGSGLADEHDAADLAKLGYKTELKRTFNVFEVFGIAFSIISLLPSIASVLSYSIPAGPVGMVWGWATGSFFIFTVALAMADLASAMPTSGGLYWWTHFFASPKYRNPLCFLVGYSNSIGFIGLICSVDYGFALMATATGVIATDAAWTPSYGEVYCVFLGCVLCHGLIATTCQRWMGRFQTFSVILNCLLILATMIALPIGRRNERNSREFVFGQVDNLTTWPAGWAFMLSWLSSIWTIGDFDSCVHMAEEASNASRAVPWGIVSSVGITGILGVLINIVLAFCMDPNPENLLGSSFGQPMAQIYYDALGKHGAIAMMCVLFTTQFCMGLSCTVAASRQTWAFSRDGALPFSSFFRPISARFGHIPVRTIWGCVLSAAVLGMLCLIAPAAASALFSLCVAGNYLAWGIAIFSRIMWGNAKFKPGPFYTGRFSKPIAIVACIFIAFTIVLAMFPVGGPNPTPQTMNYTIVINGAVWFGSMFYYAVNARKWFKGPKITLDLDDLSESQERALAEEGLDIQGIEPARRSVSIPGTQMTKGVMKTRDEKELV